MRFSLGGRLCVTSYHFPHLNIFQLHYSCDFLFSGMRIVDAQATTWITLNHYHEKESR